MVISESSKRMETIRYLSPQRTTSLRRRHRPMSWTVYGCAASGHLHMLDRPMC
jgi:hypothetical protein